MEQVALVRMADAPQAVLEFRDRREPVAHDRGKVAARRQQLLGRVDAHR